MPAAKKSVKKTNFYKEQLPLVISVVAFALAGATLLHTTLAAPRKSTSASCYTQPSTPTVNTEYTITGTGLTPNHLIGFYVTDSVGTQWTSALSDANGNVTISEAPSYSGAYTAVLKDQSVKHYTVVATCSYTVNQ